MPGKDRKLGARDTKKIGRFTLKWSPKETISLLSNASIAFSLNIEEAFGISFAIIIHRIDNGKTEIALSCCRLEKLAETHEGDWCPYDKSSTRHMTFVKERTRRAMQKSYPSVASSNFRLFSLSLHRKTQSMLYFSTHAGPAHTSSCEQKLVWLHTLNGLYSLSPVPS